MAEPDAHRCRSGMHDRQFGRECEFEQRPLNLDYLNRSASTEEGAGVFVETIAAGSAASVRPGIGVRG
jgi:hypothetical protein